MHVTVLSWRAPGVSAAAVRPRGCPPPPSSRPSGSWRCSPRHSSPSRGAGRAAGAARPHRRKCPQTARRTCQPNPPTVFHSLSRYDSPFCFQTQNYSRGCSDHIPQHCCPCWNCCSYKRLHRLVWCLNPRTSHCCPGWRCWWSGILAALSCTWGVYSLTWPSPRRRGSRCRICSGAHRGRALRGV